MSPAVMPFLDDNPDHQEHVDCKSFKLCTHVLHLCPADYLKKIIVKGLSSATTPVSKIMTAADQLAVLTPEHSVLEAMDLMLRYNVRHVPVVSTCLENYAHTYTCGAIDQAQRAQCAACAC
jgi:hypothetical protein